MPARLHTPDCDARHGEGHTHWHACGEGKRAGGGARNPLQKSSSHLSPGKTKVRAKEV